MSLIRLASSSLGRGFRMVGTNIPANDRGVEFSKDYANGLHCDIRWDGNFYEAVWSAGGHEFACETVTGSDYLFDVENDETFLNELEALAAVRK